MKSPAFQFYPDKWQSHTRRLSDSAYRVYHELMCWMWQHADDQCSIQSSTEAVACAVAMPTECVRIALAEIQNAFSPLLKEEGGRWVSNGLRKERDKQMERREKAQNSANARWEHANASHKHSGSYANGSKAQCFPSPSPSPINTPLPPDGGERVNGEAPNAAKPPTERPPETVPPPAPPWTPTEMQKRFNRFFGRRETTPWSKKEIAALRALGEIEPEVLAQTERYYAAKLPKDGDYRRHDLLTLLNNWNGECDRARRYRPTNCL